MTVELVRWQGNSHLFLMSTISNIAVSGIRAAGVRITAHAENIANAHSEGYSPLRAEQIATAIGPVVRVTKTEKARPNTQHPEEAQYPGVDPGSEFAGLIASKYDYKAAVILLRTEKELSGSLLDILA